jgi:hypothetical protein
VQADPLVIADLALDRIGPVLDDAPGTRLQRLVGGIQARLHAVGVRGMRSGFGRRGPWAASSTMASTSDSTVK